MKNLPIGIQTFQKIRDKEKNYIYKTELALNLIEHVDSVLKKHEKVN